VTRTPTPTPTPTPEPQVYIVQTDDWLSKLSDKFYGDVLAYPAIVAATNAKAAEDGSFTLIDDPDIIEVGQKLWLPTLTEVEILLEAEE
jgi:nucleoid-associated protein YgaU